jgi:hypothetical protein
MAEVNIDEEFTKKLEDFLQSLNEEQQKAFLIIVYYSIPPEAFPESADQLRPQVFAPPPEVIDYVSEKVESAAMFWGGVAGHFAGGGGWPPPWRDIAEASNIHQD